LGILRPPGAAANPYSCGITQASLLLWTEHGPWANTLPPLKIVARSPTNANSFLMVESPEEFIKARRVLEIFSAVSV